MERIGLDVARSGYAYSVADAEELADELGFPLVLRPSFTLGGAGGGIAYGMDELRDIVREGLELSPAGEVLVEESIIGWKEYEMEVMRDAAGNGIIVCSIENFDAMACIRRFHHRRAGPDAHGRGVPAHARCLACHPRGNRRGVRWIERAVRRQSARWAPHRHRDESTCEPLVGTCLQGDGLSHRQDGGQARPSATRSTRS